MYEEFYGLKERPFRMVPSPNCLYLSNNHQRALTYLQYGVMEDVGFILLTGEIGTGKTTLIRHILNELESDIQAGVIFNTNISSTELLRLILQSFSLPLPEGGKAQTLDELHKFLIQNHAEGKQTVLVIDEAQNLSLEALEEVRMLSNFQNQDQSLLQIMLVGQPELRAKLKDPRFSSLTQRIAVSYHLSALTTEEARDYIAFRLKNAGGKSKLFELEAIDMICQVSGGVPRTINLLCDAALVYGFGYELKSIPAPVIEQVIKDKGGMGLELQEDQRGTAPVVELEQAGEVTEPENRNGLLRRLEALEVNFHKLNMQTEWQVEELERRSEGFKADLVANLKKLLDEERQKYNKLLMKYTLLRYSHKKLREQIDGNGKDVSETAEDPQQAGSSTGNIPVRLRAVLQRHRLLISAWGRSTQSTTGENPTFGSTKEPRER
jgi:general secretion pathway protein A